MSTENLIVTPITESLGAMVLPADGAQGLPERTQVIDLFKRYGLLLFRGFPLDKQSFIDFTTGITPTFADYSGGAYAREPIDGDNTVLSVTGQRQFFAVPLHGEMFYTTIRPAVLWFYCAKPPAERGQTTVCDGVALFNALTKPAQTLFAEKRLKYVRRYPDGQWQQIYQTTDLAEVGRLCQERETEFFLDPADGSVVTTFLTSAYGPDMHSGQKAFVNNILPVIVQQSRGNQHSKVFLEDDSALPESVLREIEEKAEALTIELEWQEYDLAMINNTRCMHGRRAFDNPQRELYARMGSGLAV